MRHHLMLVCLLVACGGTSEDDDGHVPDAGDPTLPVANPAREIVDTKLQVDVTQLVAKATITFAPGMPGASLEVGDLVINSVTRDGASLPFAVTDKQLDIGLSGTASLPMTVEIAYVYKQHEMFDGASMRGFTFVWPYFCGNLFPCHSDPTDGTTFTLDVQGVPEGKTAIYPETIAEGPAYQVAWSIDAYVETPLGTTTAGTQLSAWHRTSETTFVMNGTQNLVAAFDWLEKTIGPYRFGTKAGTVSVAWPAGAYGGMEHHPRWHVDDNSIGSQETNVHEAAHGWFGDGIRIKCWEDFVLSEGTVTYLAARALDVVAPTVGAQTWMSYESELAGISGTSPVWPQSCGAIDILEDNLYTNAPYIRGAFFYKGVADKVGADKLDEALAAFYAAHAGKTAGMADMLDTIKTVTGYDPTTCAEMWLRSSTRPTPAPCP